MTDTPTPGPVACGCDCDADGTASISELTTALNIAFGHTLLDLCPAADSDASEHRTVTDLLLCG